MRIIKSSFYKLAAMLGIGSASLMAARMAGAQDVTIEDIGGEAIDDNLILGNASPESLAISVINWVLGILALIAVILILIGGFRWMTAGGNEEKVESAKKTLYAALIGLVIILAGWGVSVYVINNLLTFTEAGS